MQDREFQEQGQLEAAPLASSVEEPAASDLPEDGDPAAIGESEAAVADAETEAPAEAAEQTDDSSDTGSESESGSLSDAETDSCGNAEPAEPTDTADEALDGAKPDAVPPGGSKSGSITVKKSHLAIISAVAACMMLGCVLFGVWAYQNRNDAWRIDPNAKDYDFSFAGGANASSEDIAIPGYSEIIFPADTKNVQLVLLNPKGNPCYFRFTLILKDGGEVLYTSGLVPPGQAITELKLKRALDTGNYPLVIQIETFSLIDNAPMNGANVETALSVR